MCLPATETPQAGVLVLNADVKNSRFISKTFLFTDEQTFYSEGTCQNHQPGPQKGQKQAPQSESETSGGQTEHSDGEEAETKMWGRRDLIHFSVFSLWSRKLAVRVSI